MHSITFSPRLPAGDYLPICTINFGLKQPTQELTPKYILSGSCVHGPYNPKLAHCSRGVLATRLVGERPAVELKHCSSVGALKYVR